MTPQAERVSSAAPRVTDDVLSNLGLETLWYDDSILQQPSPEQAGIDDAYIVDDKLFILTRPATGSERRYLKRLDPRNGHAVWHVHLDARLEHPPTIYTYPPEVRKAPELFYSLGDTVYCLDLDNGLELWHQEMKFPISTSVVASETRIFAGSDNHRVYGVAKNSSLIDWPHLTGGEIESAPLFQGGKVVFASHDGSVYGLEQGAGWVNLQSWQFKTGDRIRADMTQYGRWVFVPSHDYKLYVLESNGSVYATFQAEAPVVTQPVVVSWQPNRELVFLVAARSFPPPLVRTLFAVPLPRGSESTTPTALWQTEGIRRVVGLGKTSLYALKDAAVSSSSERRLVALDLGTGKEKLSLPVDGFHFAPLNHADHGRDKSRRGQLFLVSQEGVVQAIREKP